MLVNLKYESSTLVIEGIMPSLLYANVCLVYESYYAIPYLVEINDQLISIQTTIIVICIDHIIS